MSPEMTPLTDSQQVVGIVINRVTIQMMNIESPNSLDSAPAVRTLVVILVVFPAALDADVRIVVLFGLLCERHEPSRSKRRQLNATDTNRWV